MHTREARGSRGGSLRICVLLRKIVKSAGAEKAHGAEEVSRCTHTEQSLPHLYVISIYVDLVAQGICDVSWLWLRRTSTYERISFPFF